LLTAAHAISRRRERAPNTLHRVGFAVSEQGNMSASPPLRIVHVARAPVGGVFRHIVDLATAQAAAGHAVGLVCDSITGGAFEDAAIAALSPRLALGALRLPMRRGAAIADFGTTRKLLRHMGDLEPDVIHGHGAKGGVYGRLVGSWLGRKRPVARIYAPHGGSLHFDAHSLEGRFYFTVERALERFTDALVHVSAYEADTYRRKVGVPRCRTVVIRNGLRADEFAPVAPDADARDLLYLGAFRDLKGTDVFLTAIARLAARHGRNASAHLIGPADGVRDYEAMAQALGIAGRVAFHPPMQAREAFARARVVVVPSRAESMPYVVLEAIAAAKPIVATNVGGIPEIFGPRADELVPAGDADALADAIEAALADPAGAADDATARRDWLQPRFNIAAKQAEIERLYRDCLAADGDRATATAMRQIEHS
jgi:glycosyltransferase involved in cell wall biosynthesis